MVQPIAHDDLTKEERSKALEAVNLIKEKRNGIIKGRTCANGSKQKKYLKDGEEISSPTVSLEAMITTLLIDAYKNAMLPFLTSQERTYTHLSQTTNT